MFLSVDFVCLLNNDYDNNNNVLLNISGLCAGHVTTFVSVYVLEGGYIDTTLDRIKRLQFIDA